MKVLGVDAVMIRTRRAVRAIFLPVRRTSRKLSLAATARNLAIVEKKGLDTYTFCNGCFGYISEFSHILLHNPAYLDMANGVVGKLGYKFEGKTRIFHVQELWYRMKDAIAKKVVRPLTGLRVAAHNGCHYVARQSESWMTGDTHLS